MRVNSQYSRTIIVGDIHGCLQELQLLLRLVNFSADDLLVAVGDLVDRGPCSWQTAAFFRDTPNALTVLGNHERRLAGVITGRSIPAWTQRHTLSKLKEGDEQQWVEYFESLPAVIETDHAIITHARLDPEKGLDEQDAYHTCGVGGEEAGIVMDEQGIPRWFHGWEEKHGSKKPVCVGHLEYERVELITGKLYGLDTEAVKAGKLTALILPEEKLVEVDCTSNHYERSHREWMALEWKQRDVLDFTISKMLQIHARRQFANSYEQDALRCFWEEIGKLSIVNRVSRLKEKLIRHFGPVPSPGYEKGQYFINIKKSLDKQWAPLMKLAYSAHLFTDAEMLLRSYQGKLTKLRRLLVDLDAFEDWLNR